MASSAEATFRGSSWLRRGAWLALRMALVGSVLAAAIYFTYSGLSANYTFHWEEALKFLWRFNVGLGATLELAGIGALLAILLGLIIALGRLSRWAVIRDLAGTYVHGFRNMPFLVIALLFYFGFGQAIRLPNLYLFGETYTPTFIWGVLALGMYEASYLGEIFRAGIQAVHRTQVEAAQSLGMNYFQTMRYVVMPQALKVIIPPFTSTLVALVKESALLSIIGVQELTFAAKQLIVPIRRQYYFEFYTILGCYYLAIVVPLSLLSMWLEKRLGVNRAHRGMTHHDA